MAIHPSEVRASKAIKIEIIRDNGEPAQEYDNPNAIKLDKWLDTNPRTMPTPEDKEYQQSRCVSKLIEAKSGEPFVIRITSPRGFFGAQNCVCVGFYGMIDGVKGVFKRHSLKRAFNKGPLMNKPFFVLEIDGVDRGDSGKRSGTSQQFMFSAFETHCDAVNGGTVRGYKKIFDVAGKIEVWVYRESGPKEGGAIEGNTRGFLNPNQKVPETAVKELAGIPVKDHTVALKRPKTKTLKRDENGIARAIKLDPENEPYLIFQFLYRSRTKLQQIGIIDRDPQAYLTPSRESSVSSSSQPQRPLPANLRAPASYLAGTATDEIEAELARRREIKRIEGLSDAEFAREESDAKRIKLEPGSAGKISSIGLAFRGSESEALLLQRAARRAERMSRPAAMPDNVIDLCGDDD